MTNEEQLKEMEDWANEAAQPGYSETTVLALCTDHRELTAQLAALREELEHLQPLLEWTQSQPTDARGHCVYCGAELVDGWPHNEGCLYWQYKKEV